METNINIKYYEFIFIFIFILKEQCAELNMDTALYYL